MSLRDKIQTRENQEQYPGMAKVGFNVSYHSLPILRVQTMSLTVSSQIRFEDEDLHVVREQAIRFLFREIYGDIEPLVERAKMAIYMHDKEAALKLLSQAQKEMQP